MYVTHRLLRLILALAIAAMLSAAARADLVAYYNFEGNFNDYPGAGAVVDNLTPTGGSLVADPAPNAKGSTQSYQFANNGGKQTAETNAWSVDLTSSDAYTIMFWIKADNQLQDLDNTRLMSMKHLPGGGAATMPSWQVEGFGGNNPDSMDLRIQGGAYGNWFARDAAGALDNDGDPSNDVWHHVAFVVSNAGSTPSGDAYMETYVDGTSLGQAVSAAVTGLPVGSTDGELIVGGHNSGNRGATGLMDDLALFDEVVDTGTIGQIASGQLSPADLLGPVEPPPPASGLLSISFDTQVDYGFPGGSTNTIPVGEPDNDVGLKLPGQEGPWNSLLFGNGQVNITFWDTRSITVDGVTFTWNPDGEGYFTYYTPVDDLRGTVPFLRATGNTTIDWELSGLEPGESYDLILFGQEQNSDGNAVNPSDFAILGHDAGNGVGMPVTLDAENDGNFPNVIASSAGLIQGTMSVRPGEGYAAVAGLQLMAPESATAIPEPSTFALAALGLLGLGIVGWRRRRK